VEQEASLLELEVELLGAGGFLPQALPCRGEAERQVLGGLERSALGLALVRVTPGGGEHGTKREVVIGFGACAVSWRALKDRSRP